MAAEEALARGRWDEALHTAAEILSWPAIGRPEMPEPYLLEIAGDVEGAASWWRERGCEYDAAMALACSGDRLRMRRALDMLYRLGAQPAAAVVARRLRNLGEHSVRRGPRPRPTRLV
jgi:hypothetical protein